MTKGRNTTGQERIQIVKECISNGNDYGGTAFEPHFSLETACLRNEAKHVQCGSLH
ncbi:hypothetical protein [Desulfosporosinus lacus]|uniref:hypothetical protein n=1 Tax=Desulfosporosinus lacus TaxID=329936 RepID=UPI0013566959